MPDASSPLRLSHRAGPRPDTTPTNPHQQLSQNAPPEVYGALLEAAFAFPDVARGPSLISVPGAQALHLAPDACGGPPAVRPRSARGPPEAFMVRTEFAHVHPPYDGSLHLMLPPEAVEEAVATGWAEPHPVARRGLLPPAVMVYAPRDEAELGTVLRILAASYAFARGRWESGEPPTRSEASRGMTG